jgi:cobalt transport protein
MTIGQRNLLLVLIAAVLAGVPALMALGVLPPLVPDAPWSGGDTQMTEMVTTLHEDYEPWSQPFFSAADAGVENLIFGLQALIGGSLVVGFIGWLVGRHHARTGLEGNERRNAAIAVVIGLVAFVALFFVRTDLGELQGFLAGMQALGLSTLAFFVGYPMGHRAGAPAHAGVRAAVFPFSRLP